MHKATATYTLTPKSIIVDLDATNGVFRSFVLDRGRHESKSALYERAYTESDIWARSHDARLESFRAE